MDRKRKAAEMINRLRDQFEEDEERKPEEDFWEVSGDGGWFYVSRAVAQDILAALRRLRRPRWIRFTDLFGSEVHMRPRDIDRVSECTLEQRARAREFHRARRAEKKADRRPWEDDDDIW